MVAKDLLQQNPLAGATVQAEKEAKEHKGEDLTIDQLKFLANTPAVDILSDVVYKYVLDEKGNKIRRSDFVNTTTGSDTFAGLSADELAAVKNYNATMKEKFGDAFTPIDTDYLITVVPNKFFVVGKHEIGLNLNEPEKGKINIAATGSKSQKSVLEAGSMGDVMVAARDLNNATTSGNPLYFDKVTATDQIRILGKAGVYAANSDSLFSANNFYIESGNTGSIGTANRYLNIKFTGPEASRYAYFNSAHNIFVNNATTDSKRFPLAGVTYNGVTSIKLNGAELVSAGADAWTLMLLRYFPDYDFTYSTFANSFGSSVASLLNANDAQSILNPLTNSDLENALREMDEDGKANVGYHISFDGNVIDSYRTEGMSIGVFKSIVNCENENLGKKISANVISENEAAKTGSNKYDHIIGGSRKDAHLLKPAKNTVTSRLVF